MFYVYILFNRRKRRLYRGTTADINRRLSEHNKGMVKSTKGFRPWNLIYYEAFISKIDARREELFLKSGKGRERLKYLLVNSLEGGQDGNALVLKTSGSNP